MEQTEIAARLAEVKEKIRGAAPRDQALDLWTDTRWLIEQLESAQERLSNCRSAKSLHAHRVERLKDERDRLAEENERLRHTLNRLANEASGFLSMADRNVHGFTNAAILRDRIQEAREISSGGRPEGDSLE